MTYKEWHKANVFVIPRLEKEEKMSDEELTEARALIALYNKKHKTATQTIKALSNKFRKLASEPDAARVYWTETKKADVKATHELGKEIGFTKYRTILSPNACALCRRKSNNGTKVFSNADLAKSGYGEFVPWHPNCYCITVPLG